MLIVLPGQYYDAETGLHYNMMRYYDPSLGRYTQADPIGIQDGPNVYLYVHANPFTGFDPTGLAHQTGQWKDCGGGCRIRIDKNHHNNDRHLHWECRGSSGTMGENGASSHGQNWEDAPQAVLDCARANGFNPEPAAGQALRCNGDCMLWVQEAVFNFVTGALVFVTTCLVLAGP